MVPPLRADGSAVEFAIPWRSVGRDVIRVEASEAECGTTIDSRLRPTGFSTHRVAQLPRKRTRNDLHRRLALRSPWLALLSLAACGGAEPGASQPLPATHARALSDVVFETTSARIERGRYLADAVIGCVLCHSERETTVPGAPPRAGHEYGGAILDVAPGYRLVAPNLTPDVATGAGAWTDDMFARAIREGVGHDGRGIGGQMWWWSFRNLSDEDLRSIVVYLRSRPPVHNALPPRILNHEQERERAEQAQPLTTAVPARELREPLGRGIYLIELADCIGCHSAWEAKLNPGAFAGGNPIERMGEVSFSANITPDPTAIGGWTAEFFIETIRSGRGGTLRSVMPWAAYRNMSDEDLRAIFLALRQVPPVRHLVSNLAVPTECVVCGQAHGFGELNTEPSFERMADDRGPLERYAGRFRLDVDEMVITLRSGALFASMNHEAPIELIPVADGRFAGRGLFSPITFERDEKGQVSALLSFELGTTRWERVL